jgi:uncharacterized repeat protein (TIGR03803 family)
MDIETRLRPHINPTTSTNRHRGIIYEVLATVALLTSQAAQAATFTTLYSFCAGGAEDCPDGNGPSPGLIQASNGDLYGTTRGGGGYTLGTIFKITVSGKLTTLHSFEGPDGESPQTGLIQADNDSFYGTTEQGGADDGTIFELSPSGNLTTVGSFDQATELGIDPSRLIQAANGDFYGTTMEGGATSGGGTIFKFTSRGTLTTLYSFICPTAESCPEGNFPSALIQAANGDFYGTTFGGGANANGTVFKITSGGTLTTLHNFCAQTDCTDGLEPLGGLIQANNGDLYGTTLGGGAFGYGSVFKITHGGTLTTVYSFCSQGYPGCADGYYPEAGPIQASDGNFYGTTTSGGANGYGTIFKLTPNGTLTTLYSLCSQTDCTDSGEPNGLIQDTNGDFYGTSAGGANGLGAVFSLSVGIGPFVETQTASGKAGAAVKILGSDLTGATSVTFNGTVATFTVVSKSEITTKVPTGATTGPVEVATPGGTLTSNRNFTVKP